MYIYLNTLTLVKEKLAAIPLDDKELKLGGVTNLTGEQLVSVFAAIPAHVTHLNLHGEHLDHFSSEQLAAAFAAIHPHVSTIDLSCTFLDTFRNELNKVLKALPHVLYLNLEYNDLSRIGKDPLISALAVLPTQLHSLNLEYNFLERFSIDTVKDIFAALPQQLGKLYLRDQIGQCSGADPAENWSSIFTAMPRQLKQLNLKNFELERRTGDELIAAMSALPESLTSLRLECNNLRSFSHTVLINAIRAIKAPITELCLRQTHLSKFKSAELVEIFQALPPSLRVINLEYNSFSSYTLPELITLFSALPKNLIQITLSDTLDCEVINHLPSLVSEIIHTYPIVQAKTDSILHAIRKEGFKQISEATPFSSDVAGIVMNYIGKTPSIWRQPPLAEHKQDKAEIDITSLQKSTLR